MQKRKEKVEDCNSPLSTHSGVNSDLVRRRFTKKPKGTLNMNSALSAWSLSYSLSAGKTKEKQIQWDSEFSKEYILLYLK